MTSIVDRASLRWKGHASILLARCDGENAKEQDVPRKLPSCLLNVYICLIIRYMARTGEYLETTSPAHHKSVATASGAIP